jgi:hypothetical protein
MIGLHGFCFTGLKIGTATSLKCQHAEFNVILITTFTDIFIRERHFPRIGRGTLHALVHGLRFIVRHLPVHLQKIINSLFSTYALGDYPKGSEQPLGFRDE